MNFSGVHLNDPLQFVASRSSRNTNVYFGYFMNFGQEYEFLDFEVTQTKPSYCTIAEILVDFYK